MNSTTSGTTDPQELERLNHTIAKLYAAISFKKDQFPNIRHLKDIFIQQGILIDYTEAVPSILPVQEFITHFEKQYENGFIMELAEIESRHITRIHGRVAHRFSFYEARFGAEDPEPFSVGVNSIQLIKEKEDWLISSMAWDDDEPSNNDIT